MNKKKKIKGIEKLFCSHQKKKIIEKFFIEHIEKMISLVQHAYHIFNIDFKNVFFFNI